MRVTLRGKIVFSILALIILSIPVSILNRLNITEAATSYTYMEPSDILIENTVKSDVSTEANRTVEAAPALKLVSYEGVIEHIFFHPLIAYPELAFDGDKISQGYDDWFVTVKEFNAILNSLYEKNYILVDINCIWEEKLDNGKRTIVKKSLMLPEGKKPLIISIDDLNYYEYMQKNGNVHKLILTAEGEVVTYTAAADGTELVSKENEIIPILDSFVEQHKDFSHEGAKGIIALTGYEGILGYRTDLIDSPNYEREMQQAVEVVKRLKAAGWTFASHSYGHRDANQISYKRLLEDTLRWNDEVGKLVGPTNIYVYPYGSRLPENDPKYRHLLESGFNIILSVGDSPYIKFDDRAINMDRRHIDGIAFKQQRDRYLDLFDSSEFIDDSRPKN